jgi:hypothetical protein
MSVFEIVLPTFFPHGTDYFVVCAYGKASSRNVLKDFESRPAATNIKVLLVACLGVVLCKLTFLFSKTGAVLKM